MLEASLEWKVGVFANSNGCGLREWGDSALFLLNCVLLLKFSELSECLRLSFVF